jgi:hypothetical protein
MNPAVSTTYDETSFGRPVLDLGTSLELGAWDLGFHKMTHFERKKGWGGASFPEALSEKNQNLSESG